MSNLFFHKHCLPHDQSSPLLAPPKFGMEKEKKGFEGENRGTILVGVLHLICIYHGDSVSIFCSSERQYILVLWVNYFCYVLLKVLQNWLVLEEHKAKLLIMPIRLWCFQHNPFSPIAVQNADVFCRLGRKFIASSTDSEHHILGGKSIQFWQLRAMLHIQLN